MKKAALFLGAICMSLSVIVPEGSSAVQARVVTEAAVGKKNETSATSGSAIKTKPQRPSKPAKSNKPVKKNNNKPVKKNKKKKHKKQPKKTVYLTFDDGPGSRVTPKLLKVLKDNKVKATFFIVGYEGKANKKLLKRIVKDGHTIAIHTYTHDYRKIYSSKKAFLSDFHKTEKLIVDTTGVKPHYFRFPGGGNNHYMSKKLRKSILKELHKEGYTEMDWNCGTSDAAATYYSAAQLIRYGKNTHWGPDPIVLLQHDANTKYHTPEVTRALIKYYRSKGYHFSGLSDYPGPEMCFK